MTHASRTSARPGFTLVELLVTIGIITLLAAILIVAIGNAGVRARQDATAALIRKISNQVQERLEAFDRLKSQIQFKSKAIAEARNNGFSGTSFTDPQREILGFKMLMQQYFPQRFADLPGGQGGTEYLDQFSLTTPQYPFDVSKHQTETESSELLYYFLTRGRALGIPTVDPGEYRASEVADTDGDGLLEFVDAWGKPLRFYRWPTRLFRSGGTSAAIDRSPAVQYWQPLFNGIPPAATPDPLGKDPDDPTFLVNSLITESLFHTPATYHVFLIVSSGPDGQKMSSDVAFGLGAPTDTTNGNHLARPIAYDALTDNITNRNR